MAGLSGERSYEMGMHTEQLGGRTLETFFDSEEEEHCLYPWAFDVDPAQSRAVDAADLDSTEINLRIRQAMADGCGTVRILNPGAKHSLGVGILNRLELISKAPSDTSASGSSTVPTSVSRAVSDGHAPRT